MDDAVWVAAITALASVLVAFVTARQGRKDRQEIKGSVEENTALIGQSQREARTAFTEANALNRKIIELGARLDNSIVVSARESGEMRQQLQHIGEEVAKLAGAAGQEKAVLEGKLHVLRNQVSVLQNQDKALEIAAVRKEQRDLQSGLHVDRIDAKELHITEK